MKSKETPPNRCRFFWWKTVPATFGSSTSAAEVDIAQSYTLRANCYITKPVDLKGFLTAVRAIGTFCFSVVSLPHPPPL
ncbi:MAG TPA: hypothetical protein VFE27_20380 [Acidobacteriaceae bacterium]|jgi:hypothetical protein|nr:hypothetical protein [Acidobacteriaceae bacterium]